MHAHQHNLNKQSRYTQLIARNFRDKRVKKYEGNEKNAGESQEKKKTTGV